MTLGCPLTSLTVRRAGDEALGTAQRAAARTPGRPAAPALPWGCLRILSFKPLT